MYFFFCRFITGSQTADSKYFKTNHHTTIIIITQKEIFVYQKEKFFKEDPKNECGGVPPLTWFVRIFGRTFFLFKIGALVLKAQRIYHNLLQIAFSIDLMNTIAGTVDVCHIKIHSLSAHKDELFDGLIAGK